MERDTTIPAAEDFRRTMQPKITDFNVPLMRDTKIVERPADQTEDRRRSFDRERSALSYLESGPTPN